MCCADSLSQIHNIVYTCSFSGSKGLKVIADRHLVFPSDFKMHLCKRSWNKVNGYHFFTPWRKFAVDSCCDSLPLTTQFCKTKMTEAGAVKEGLGGSEKWKSELIVSSVLMRSADLLCHPACGSRQAARRGSWLTQISLESIVESSM